MKPWFEREVWGAVFRDRRLLAEVLARVNPERVAALRAWVDSNPPVVPLPGVRKRKRVRVRKRRRVKAAWRRCKGPCKCRSRCLRPMAG
jgi:hypothetical protein